jgi:hypothetical protein
VARFTDPAVSALVPVPFTTPVNVAAPVPPEATGRGVERVSEETWFVTSTKFVPLLNTHMDLPAGTATPVPVVFLTVTVSARPLLMM